MHIHIYRSIYVTFTSARTKNNVTEINLKGSSELTGVRLIFLPVFSRNSYEPKNACIFDAFAYIHIHTHTQRMIRNVAVRSIAAEHVNPSRDSLRSFLRPPLFHSYVLPYRRAAFHVCTVHEREQARKIEKERNTVTHRHMRSLLHWYAYLGRTQWTADAWRYTIVHGSV